jgi:hypothetical protein
VLARALRHVPLPAFHVGAEHGGRSGDSPPPNPAPRPAEPPREAIAPVRRVEGWLRLLDFSPEYWGGGGGGSRIWKPNSPPLPLLIRGGRAVSREGELVILVRPRVRAPIWPSFGPNPYYRRSFSVFASFTGAARDALIDPMRRCAWSL